MATPYLISGTVYRTFVTGRVDVRVTISGVGSTQDIIIKGSTDIAASQLLTFTNLTTDETGTDTTNASGQYSFDCQNFTSGYTDGDIIKIVANNKVTTDDIDVETDETYVRRKEYHESSKARKRILVDLEGNEFTEENPMPVFILDDNFENVNCDRSWVVTRGDGQPDSESVVYKGDTYTRTFTFTSNILTARTKWVKQ